MIMGLDLYMEFTRVVRQQSPLLPNIEELISKPKMAKKVKKPKKIKY